MLLSCIKFFFFRKYESSEAELNLLKLELGKSEAHNIALEK